MKQQDSFVPVCVVVPEDPRWKGKHDVAVTFNGSTHRGSLDFRTATVADVRDIAVREGLPLLTSTVDYGVYAFGQLLGEQDPLSVIESTEFSIFDIKKHSAETSSAQRRGGPLVNLFGKRLRSTTAQTTNPSEKQQQQVKGETDDVYSVKLAIGSVVEWQGMSAPVKQSHKWYVYVRGMHNEDISDVVEKVIFNMHCSFPNPERVVTSPPFEISERGWGQFYIGVQLFLKGFPGRPVMCTHFLAFSREGALPLPHSIPPHGAPFKGNQFEGIPPFVFVTEPFLNETFEEIVVSSPPEDVRNCYKFHQYQVHCSRRGISRYNEVLKLTQALDRPSEADFLAGLRKIRDDLIGAEEALEDEVKQLQTKRTVFRAMMQRGATID